MFKFRQFCKHDIGRNIKGRNLRERFVCYLNQCLGVERRIIAPLRWTINFLYVNVVHPKIVIYLPNCNIIDSFSSYPREGPLQCDMKV